MTSPKGKNESGPETGEVMILRLYIAGEGPNSIRALANLKAICQKYIPSSRFQIEIVDILQEPLRAFADEILLTPTLVKLAPHPIRKIVGNLSETTKVLLMLGLEEESP